MVGHHDTSTHILRIKHLSSLSTCSDIGRYGGAPVKLLILVFDEHANARLQLTLPHVILSLLALEALRLVAQARGSGLWQNLGHPGLL